MGNGQMGKFYERQQATPEGITQLNDSIYQLYAPPQPVPEIVVIFFHGLSPEADYTTAYWKTWLSRDGKIVWPKEWLAKELPGAQILSVSYDSSVSRHDGSSDSYEISENLIRNIILDPRRVGQDCPVVLVGHSLGGIIIKEFILSCFRKMGQLSNSENSKPTVDRIENFLGNCKGVFYYSTPQSGSKFVKYLVGKRVNLNDPLMKLLKVLSVKTARINSEFACARIGTKIKAFAIVESRDTTYMEFKGRMVEEASARQDIEDFYTAQDANHFDVCKARNKDSCNIFGILHTFIKTAKEPGPGLHVAKIEVTMGNRASTSQPAKRKLPGEIHPLPADNNQTIKLNDSVFQLYTPQGVPEAVVIFFHGLSPEEDYRTAYLKTWLSRDGKIVWPKEWLAEELPRAQILSVSYDSHVLKHDGEADTYGIAENLIHDLILERRVAHGCPVVLVGHSLGGIIVKEFLLACLNKRGQLRHRKKADIDRIEQFLGKCKGVFYYSTPHQGSEFIDYLIESSDLRLNDSMKLFKTLSKEAGRINHEFRNARLGEGILTEAMGETLATTYMGFTGKIVESSSARQDTEPLSFYEPREANHFDVCKATNKETCSIFRNLLGFVGLAIHDEAPGLSGKILEMCITLH